MVRVFRISYGMRTGRAIGAQQRLAVGALLDRLLPDVPAVGEVLAPFLRRADLPVVGRDRGAEVAELRELIERGLGAVFARSPSRFSAAGVQAIGPSTPQAMRSGFPLSSRRIWRSGNDSGSYSVSGTGISELRKVISASPQPQGPISSSPPNSR